MIRARIPGAMVALALAAPTLGGCISTVTSKPATEAAKGIRYALPVPVLKFTPRGDGTMALEVLYIPDPANTYTLESKSYLAAHTLDVKLKEGLLESVSFSGDATGLGEKALGSYGEIEKAKIEARIKAEEDAAKDAKDKAESAAAKAKALSDAESALAVAQRKRDMAQSMDAPIEIRIAAENAVIDAEQTLQRLRAASSAAASENSAAMAKIKDSGHPEAFGPVLYRMAPASDGKVDLIADAPQVIAASFKPPKPDVEVVSLVFTIAPPAVVRPSKNGLVVKLRANKAFEALESVTLSSADATKVIRPVRATKAVELGETVVYVTFDDKQAYGEYMLSIRAKIDDKNSEQPEDVTVELRGRFKR